MRDSSLHAVISEKEGREAGVLRESLLSEIWRREGRKERKRERAELT